MIEERFQASTVTSEGFSEQMNKKTISEISEGENPFKLEGRGHVKSLPGAAFQINDFIVYSPGLAKPDPG
jgi:hypothetical protein